MTLILGILVLCLLAWLFLYKREIGLMRDQLRELQGQSSNQLLSQDLYSPELNQLVASINDSLMQERDLRLQLEKKEKLQQEFLTNISHDIRTPLTSLDGYIQLLSQAEGEAEAKRYLAVVENRLDKLGQLLDQMFLYMKLADEDYQLEGEAVKLKAFLLSQLFDFYEDFASLGKEPQIDLPDQEVMVWANEDLLKQVLDNLIQNALIHGDGSLAVHLSQEGRLTLSNGMEETFSGNPDQVFDRFYRAETNRTKETSGLGLSIAYSALEKMSGKIRVKTKERLFIIEIDLLLI